MSPVHAAFLALTCVAPLILCPASRRRQSERFDRAVERGIAGMLLVVQIGQFFFKILIERMPLTGALPMHLCDWALLATFAALWWRAPRCFEVAYFWGLAGTIQGLLTPAIDPDLAWWRQAAFFLIHSGIVVGILFLVFAKGLRPVPASLRRVLIWSQFYLLAALAVNAITGENYGFLSHPPATASLLDHFPQTRWQYIATINGVALTAFALLYLPWWLADLRKRGID